MFALLFAVETAQAIDYPEPDGMVTDLAELLPPDLEERVEAKVVAYKAQTTIEIAVVTLPSLDGADPCAYAQELWNQWGVGNAQDNNGVMLLVAPSDSKNCIATGYGIEPYFTDLETARVRTEIMRPLNRAEKRAEAVEAGVDAIIRHLGETPWAQRTPPEAVASTQETANTVVCVILSIVVIVFVLALLILSTRRRGRYSSYGRYSSSSSSYDYGSGGGYSGGGHSSSSSSSSDSGGGSFSGGDSGGGGSGGSD